MQYTDEQRSIFKYYNGEKDVYGDPLELFSDIMVRTNGNPDDLTKKVFTKISGASQLDILATHEAQKRLVAIVRDVFKMTPFNAQDGTGALVEHCLAVWRLLARTLHQKKRTDDGSPTASASSAGPPVSPTVTASTSP